MAQLDASNKGPTNEQKCIQQLVDKLQTKHAKEFAVTPYDGVLVAMHKTAFAQTTAVDSLIYELTSFGGTVGTGLLQYMTPGSVIPLFPSAVKASDDGDVEVTHGHRFMDKAFILSGAEHVDKTDQLIPDVHKYDKIVSSMAQAVRTVERDQQEFGSFSNNAGAEVLDATSDDSLTAEYVSDIFANFFPHIGEEERQDYVVYVACHTKAAIDYVLSNLDVLKSGKKGKSSSLLVSPTTMRVVVDNQRLCVESPAYCRMLVCSDNEVMLKPGDVENIFGNNMRVRDPILKQFNKALKDGMTFEKEVCTKLAPCKFLVSLMASAILYDNPTPVQLLPLGADNSVEMLTERINLIANIYIKNKPVPKSKVNVADQLACMSLGILKNAGISPESVRVYRTDTVVAEQNEKRSPWPATFQQHIRNNIKSKIADMNTDATETQKCAVQLKEAMGSSVFHLLTLINYRDHVFNADVFKNPLELYSDFVKKHPDRHVDKPGTELNYIKIKPLCGQFIFNGQFSIIQNLFARFHFDPVAFKRFFVINALYYLGEHSVSMEETVTKAPVPDSIEIVNGKGYPLEESAAKYTCASCGDVPFYERDGPHCLCFLLLKVVATLTDTQMDTLAKLKTVYDDYVRKIPNNLNFNGPITSYKTLHTVTVNETQSSSGNFGKIQLKHAGKTNGFGIRNKTINDKSEVDASVGGKQPTGNDVKEHLEQDNEMSSYLETRKMEWIVKNVKTEMKRLATLGDPTVLENGEMKDSPLWSLQRLWVPADKDGETGNIELQDFRCFVTGTKDNPIEMCRNALLTGTDQVYPLLITDSQPDMNKVDDREHQSLDFGRSRDTQKRKHTDNDGWQCDDEEEYNDDDEQVTEVETKKPKLDYRAVVAKKMESLIYSVLYKLSNAEQIGSINVDQIHPRHRPLITKWNEKPKKYKTLFREVLLKTILGQNCSIQNPVDTDDHSSLVARVVKAYLQRLPAFISNVHNAVAKTLGLSAQELDDDFSKIVHYTEKTKRELVSWLDVGGADSLNKRSTMLTLYELVRHEVEARATNIVASETQAVSKSNAETILRANSSGPYCVKATGNVNIHLPTIDRGDDGMPVLSINDKAAENTAVACEMHLPVKMKVSMNVTEIDENRLKKGKNDNSTRMDDVDDTSYADSDDKRFVPRSLLNEANTSSKPVMVNTPKPAHELIEILKDEDLLFTRVGTNQFADVTKTASTVQILQNYILRRTSGKKVKTSHNLIMDGYFRMINRTLTYILMLLKSTVSLLSSVVNGLNEMPEISRISEKLACDVVFLKVLESGVHAVCKRNPPLASSLYLMALCSELYGPPCTLSDRNIDLDRDNQALNAVVAGCLRLFVGPDDCNKITRKADSRQVRMLPVLWTYMNGREKPYGTTVDISRSSASQMMLNLQIGSYTSSHGNNAVLTSVRGGMPLTRGVAPIINTVAKTQFVEGEHNHFLCRPLVWVNNRLVERAKDNISCIVETYPMQMFVRYVLENAASIPALLTYYSSFLSKSQEECTEDDLWEACLKAHRITRIDDDTELFRIVVFPKLYAAMAGCAVETCVIEEDEEEDDYWSESDE